MVPKSLFLVVLLAAVGFCDTGYKSTVRVTETDNSPSCTAGQIKFSPGTVTCSGQTATVTNTGGGGGGGGNSVLETIFGTTRSSPTATIKTSTDFKGSVVGSTNTLSLNSNNTAINTFVSSVTVAGAGLLVNYGVNATSATFGSSTATSFGNNSYVTINSSGSSQGLKLVVNGQPSGSLQSKIGALTIQSLTTGGPPATGLVIHDSTTDPQDGGGLMEIWEDNPNHNDPLFWIHNVGSLSNPAIRIDDNAPDLEMVNTSTDNAHGMGKWEPFAMANQGVDLQINSRAYDDSTFENLAYWQALQKDKDLGPGLYVKNQSLTNDSGVMSSSSTAGISFYTLNNHIIGLTGPKNVASGSWRFALPSTPNNLGQVLYQSTNSDGTKFGDRQWEFTTGGNTGDVLTYNSGSAPTWTTVSVSPGGSNGTIQFNSGGSFAGTTNFILTDGAGAVSTTLSVKSSSAVFTYSALGNNSNGPALYNTDSVLAASGVGVPPGSNGTDNDLWFSTLYGDLAHIGSPPRDVYAYQMGVTPYGVIVEPAYRGPLSAVRINRAPSAAFQVGYGNVAANPSNAKSVVNYPGGGTFVAIDSDTVHQAYFGIVSSYTVVGSTSATDVHLDVQGQPVMVSGTSGVNYIKWADGTVQTSSPTPSAGGSTSPGSPTNSVQFNSAGSFAGSSLFRFYSSTGSVQNTYGAIVGSMTVNDLTASQYVKTDSAKKLASQSGVPTTDLTGTLQAAQEPAHTGDVTNSAGSLVLSAAARQPNITTFVSSITVLGANGLLVPYQVSAGSFTGAGLTTCGDATHGLGWSSTDNKFTCQSITGSGGSGGVSVYPATATASFPFGLTASSITASDALISPVGSNPVMDTAGKIAVDTTDDQLLFYGNSVNVIPSTFTKTVTIENLVQTDSGTVVGLWNAYDVTITKIGCVCSGTCSTTASFGLMSADGAPVTLTEPTCATLDPSISLFTAGTDSPTTGNNTVTAGSPLRLTISNTPAPTTDTYTVSISYRVNRK